MRDAADTAAAGGAAGRRTDPRLTALCYAGMTTYGVVLLLVGGWLPSLRLSASQAGTLGAMPLAGVLAATPLAGPLLDSAGAKAMMAAAALLTAAALAATPSARGWGFGALATAAFAFGFGGGLLNTASNTLISDLSGRGGGAGAETERAAALNRLGVFFCLGAVGTPLLMSFAGADFSIAAVFYLLAAAVAVMAPTALAIPFPTPARAGASPWRLLRVLRSPMVGWIALLLAIESGNESSLFVWTGRVTQSALGTSARAAALALLAVPAAMGAGRWAATRGLRRLGHRRALLTGAAVMLLGVLITAPARSYGEMLAGWIVIGLGAATIYPTVLGVAGTRFPRDTGTIFGGVMAVSLIGGALAPRLAAGPAGGANPRLYLWFPAVAAVVVAILAWKITARAGR